MAQAGDHPTPIKDLDDLLRYLTEELVYEKYAALCELQERIWDGQLRLTRQRHVDGKPYSPTDGKPYNPEPVDPSFFRSKLILDFDHRHDRVEVIERIVGLSWDFRYRIAEGCDVRAICWSRRPPASQPAPAQQLEDKTGDPVEAEADDGLSTVESPQETKVDGWQVRRVKEVLREFIFSPDGRPPTDTTVKAVQTDVNEIFDAWGWKLASRDTVARAMGRRPA
jgi:hypothetical protein